jgi:hypothetical protein
MIKYKRTASFYLICGLSPSQELASKRLYQAFFLNMRKTQKEYC